MALGAVPRSVGGDTIADFFLSHERDGDRLAAIGRTEEACAAYERALALNPSAAWIAAKRDRLLAPGASGRRADASSPKPHSDHPRAFYLFAPFYTPADPERAAELVYCLDRNLERGLFAQIVLMIDDDTPPPRQDRRLRIVQLNRRPTYLDWMRTSRRLCPGHISVLANSDIHFDESIGHLAEIFASEQDAFVALSRFDKQRGALTPHPNPHWSQDAWAFIPGTEDDPLHDRRFDIPLGVPRCDNKIAYVFATSGHQVYNPFPFVRSIHVHETNLRYYSKRGDRRILGGVAMVHPGAALTEPARLDIEVWSAAGGQVGEVKLNRSLERWAEEARRAAQPRPCWVAHDAGWQHPAITEKHAFDRVRAALPSEHGLYDSVYLGFPFATLVDFHAQLGPEHPRTRALQQQLNDLRPRLEHYSRIVSVAQHIRANQFPQIFAEAGVTNLFWSHCAVGQNAFPGAPTVRLHPFPLYPVQQALREESDFARRRRWLFSFVGAWAAKNYLTTSRNMIIDLLSQDPRGKVIDRDAWHYQNVVYDAQVLGRTSCDQAGLLNDEHSAVFREVMDESVFSLCPSGTGPNSIRLWEALLNGSIPVVLADTWAAPGPAELWERACVRCPETLEAIAALPDRLAAIAANPGRLRAMRTALLELARRYGPEGFVPDVLELFAEADAAAAS